MSNKTQLQANNTQLASLIQTLQGKAAGGGSGGNVRIYPAGEVSKGTKLGDCTLTYACPLDELDFFTMSMDKLTVLASAVMETKADTVNLIDFFANSLGARVLLQADESYKGYYNADAIVLYMEMSGVFHPVVAIMAKITPEIIAAEGLSIEPGIYLVHSQTMRMSMSVIYTGP